MWAETGNGYINLDNVLYLFTMGGGPSWTIMAKPLNPNPSSNPDITLAGTYTSETEAKEAIRDLVPD